MQKGRNPLTLPSTVKSHTGMRRDCHTEVTLLTGEPALLASDWIRLVPTSVILFPQSVNNLGPQTGRNTHNTVIPNVFHLCSAQVILKPGDRT